MGHMVKPAISRLELQSIPPTVAANHSRWHGSRFRDGLRAPPQVSHPKDLVFAKYSDSNRLAKKPQEEPAHASPEKAGLSLLSAYSLPGGLRLAVCVGIFVCLCACGCGKKALRKDDVSGFTSFLSNLRTSPPLPPAIPESWKDKGLRLARQKDFGEAIEAFKRHVEENPEEFFGFNAIAICYKNLGDHANAMKNFNRALEFAETPEAKAKVIANIGNLYLSAGKPQAALGYYKEAHVHCPEDLLFLASIARAFITLEDLERARKVLQEAESMQHPKQEPEETEDRGMGHYLLAYCYAAMSQRAAEEEDSEKVVKHAELALKADPDKFVNRIRKELADEKSPWVSFKDNKELNDLIRTYRDKTSLASWLEGT